MAWRRLKDVVEQEKVFLRACIQRFALGNLAASFQLWAQVIQREREMEEKNQEGALWPGRGGRLLAEVSKERIYIQSISRDLLKNLKSTTESVYTLDDTKEERELRAEGAAKVPPSKTIGTSVSDEDGLKLRQAEATLEAGDFDGVRRQLKYLEMHFAHEKCYDGLLQVGSPPR